MLWIFRPFCLQEPYAGIFRPFKGGDLDLSFTMTIMWKITPYWLIFYLLGTHLLSKYNFDEQSLQISWTIWQLCFCSLHRKYLNKNLDICSIYIPFLKWTWKFQMWYSRKRYYFFTYFSRLPYHLLLKSLKGFIFEINLQ